MGISSLTDRKAFATASLLLVVVVSTVFTGIFIEVTGTSDALYAVSLIAGPFALVQLVHGEVPEVPGLTLPFALAGIAGWTLLGAIVCRTRYRLLQVTS